MTHSGLGPTARASRNPVLCLMRVAKAPCPNLCSNGSCGGSCPPSSKQCGAKNTPQTCSPQGTWEPDAKPCDFVCTGAGVCGGQCQPGSKQCAGPAPQTCDTTG